MIKPTIGRVVWYWREPPKDDKAQPEAATVAFVHNDNLVNLHIIDHNGVACSKTSVVLRQPEDGVPSHSYCEWMPYQIGQAKAQAPRPQGEESNYLTSQTQPGVDVNRVVSPTPTPVPPEPTPDPPGKLRAR